MDGWVPLEHSPRVPRLVGRPLLCLTDIAGDLAALESVLSAVRHHRLAGIVACGNHVVGGPHPFEVWTRLQSLGAALTCGPTDLAVAALHDLEITPRSPEAEARLQAFVRARAALGDVVCRRLGELPTTTVVSLDDTRGVMAQHGSPVDDDDDVLVDDDRLADRVAAVAEDVLVSATGRPFARRLSLPSIIPIIDEDDPVGIAPPRSLLVVGLGAVGTPPGVIAPRRRTAQAVLIGAGDDGAVHAFGADIVVSRPRTTRRAV